MLAKPAEFTQLAALVGRHHRCTVYFEVIASRASHIKPWRDATDTERLDKWGINAGARVGTSDREQQAFLD
jgi:hypothetical protein